MTDIEDNEISEDEYIARFIQKTAGSEPAEAIKQHSKKRLKSLLKRLTGAIPFAAIKAKSASMSLSLEIFFSLSLIFKELVVRISMDINHSAKQFFNISLLYTLLFSAFFGICAGLLCELIPNKKVKKIFACGISLCSSVLFLIEFFLKQTYGNYMGLSVIFKSAGAVAGSYSSMIWGIILRGIPMIILLLVPLILLVVFSKNIFTENKKTNLIKNAAAAAASLLAALVLIFSLQGGAISDKQYFTSSFNINKSTTRFGLMCSTFLDGSYALFGTPQKASAKSFPVYIPKLDMEEYANIDNIDFSAVREDSSYSVRALSDYFASLSPTEKNIYTGMFEGKNLIFICAEAFTSHVIDPNDTPTLYKLANNGFVFKNYYKPSWMVSTSDGEYSLLTGLIPEYGVQSMYVGRYNNWYYTMANALSREGYNTYAYHNHYYAYYDRDLTHENLGYDVWMGMGNGMEQYVEEQWPESDLEMIEGTTQLFLNSDTPFHVYYLTVSGHTEYNFDGNSMAYKNMNEISDTTSSSAVRAIKAANQELEKALTRLLDDLEKAGKLDDTVIVLSPDHYPYGLSDDAYNELAGQQLDTNFERYHNTLIIYNSAMAEKVVVDKPCSDIDVLPTLLNLFGIDYDSRLLMGKDILSNSSPLVVFQNYSWITDKGRYNGDTGEFIPNEGVDIPDGYVKTISNIVTNKVLYSEYILETDYYDLIFSDQK